MSVQSRVETGARGPSDGRVVLVTAPDPDEAARLARTLVEERLVACVNLVAGIRSIYRWQDEVCDDRETLLIMKTTDRRIESLVARVRELHSYSVPEVIALPVVAGAEAYLAWVREETEPGEAE